jgi:hypothetical protein
MFSVGVLILFCFAPSRIKDVTKDANDPDRVPAETLLGQVRKHLPHQVNECITGLLKFNPNLRPSARSFLGSTDEQTGEHRDSYFSRADTDRPGYWEDADLTEELIRVTDSKTMEALCHAVEPQLPLEFGTGLDAGQHWPKSIAKDNRSIEVVKAWRIQNETIWKQFSVARERVADDVSHGPPLQSNEAPVCNRAKMMKPKTIGVDGSGCSQGGIRLEEAAKTGFTPHVDGQAAEDAGRRDINETFLLHGKSFS